MSALLGVDATVAWLLVTAAAFWVGTWCYARTRKNAVLNPMVVAGPIVIAALVATGTDYAAYAESVALLEWLTGPAIVALAVPLYHSLEQIRQALAPALVVILIGAATAVVTGAGFAVLAGGGPEVVAAMAPKSVTTPVALAIAERVGGVEGVTAVFVLLTGVTGALTSNALCRLLGVHDHRAQGLVLGVTAHVLGVARGFSISHEMGTFAAVGMGLSALVAALLLPVVVALVR
ncbi:MAG: LrgB family protein [Alphaproteobacteria bacterium]|jgi:predicted murein hydrolase (TIGR00659 family)|nr:LrgB family protein [Alphaproteobacteria bacterium]